MCVRAGTFTYLCSCGWKMDTEGVTLFKSTSASSDAKRGERQRLRGKSQRENEKEIWGSFERSWCFCLQSASVSSYAFLFCFFCINHTQVFFLV